MVKQSTLQVAGRYEAQIIAHCTCYGYIENPRMIRWSLLEPLKIFCVEYLHATEAWQQSEIVKV